MKIAFLFSGQGAQSVGMGKDIYEEYEEARQVYTKASKILETDIAKLCFEGPEEKLNQTENTQIAVLVTSLAILEVLKKHKIEAKICAGLSLGEYTALIYGGYLSLEDGLKLIQKRGYDMEHYIPNEDFKMVAVMGLNADIIEKICKQIEKKGRFVMPANYNYSGQIVISGNIEAVEEAEEEFKKNGVKRLITLKTNRPFHTKKLENAKQEFEKALDQVTFHNGTVDVVKNIDGTVYRKEDCFGEILANHMISPVRFDKTIKKMKEEGIDIYIEIGPGKVLSGFVKKEEKNKEAYAVSDLQVLKEVINKFGKE